MSLGKRAFGVGMTVALTASLVGGAVGAELDQREPLDALAGQGQAQGLGQRRLRLGEQAARGEHGQQAPLQHGLKQVVVGVFQCRESGPGARREA